MLRLGALVLLGTTLCGCASTSGREWLNSPIDERPLPSSLETAQLETTSEARPRLSRTITLGQSYSDPAAPTPAPSAPSAPVVQVNVPVTINNYAGYGYAGYGTTRASTSTARPVVRGSTSGATQPVGGNWPAVPDYGPKAMR